MKVDVQKHGSVTIVVPRDALTESNLPDAQRILASEAQQAVRLVLDLTHVPFLDSTGIEFLLTLAGNTAGGALLPRIASIGDTVREALYLTDTLKRFQVFDTVEAAVRSFV